MKKNVLTTCNVMLLFVLFLTVVSCNNASNTYKNKMMYPEFNRLMVQASKIPQKKWLYVDLPMGYHFSMTKQEALLHSEEIANNGSILGFPATLEERGGLIKLDDILPSYTFKITGLYPSRLQSFLQSLEATMDSTWAFFNFEFPDEYYKDKKIYQYCWIKENNFVNLYIKESSLMSSHYATLTYENVPLYIQWLDKQYRGYMSKVSVLYPSLIAELGPQDQITTTTTSKTSSKSTRVNNSDVTNSPWDGSVYQVKRYVKSRLKYPDSYESVNWGKVREIGNNYEVSHVYRAKNSFGAYVVEGGVFTLSKDGTVINYTPVK